MKTSFGVRPNNVESRPKVILNSLTVDNYRTNHISCISNKTLRNSDNDNIQLTIYKTSWAFSQDFIYIEEKLQLTYIHVVLKILQVLLTVISVFYVLYKIRVNTFTMEDHVFHLSNWMHNYIALENIVKTYIKIYIKMLLHVSV